ncbi:MAG: glycosyltransferase [Gaiellaceae bacterium]
MSPSVTEPRAKVLIPTSRRWFRIPSYGTVLDFEDAMAAVADVDYVSVPPYSRRRVYKGFLRGRRDFAPVVPPGETYDLCLLVAMEPSWAGSLRYVDRLRTRCRHVVIYVFDAWLRNIYSIQRDRRQWELCDWALVSFRDAVDAYAAKLRCPVEYMPQAIDPTRFHGDRIARPIDILSTGRRLDSVHAELLRLAKERDLFYFFSETRAPTVIDLHESQSLIARLCQAARLQVCWPTETTAEGGHGEISGVTARWFEAAACGSIVVGRPPRASEFRDLFPYESFVLSLDPSSPREIEETVIAALADDDELRKRRGLSEYVRRAHSWHARCASILERCNLPFPRPPC